MDNLERACEPLVALARTHSALQQHELAEVRIGAERTVRVIESCITLIRALKPSRVEEDLAWTTAIPTVPGFYWWRGKDEPFINPKSSGKNPSWVWHVARFEMCGPDNDIPVATLTDGERGERVELDGAEWYGPIQPPAKAAEAQAGGEATPPSESSTAR